MTNKENDVVNNLSQKPSFLRLALLWIILIVPAPLYAQETPSQTLRFTRLTIDEGLSNPAVQVLLQDQQGFIWVGTEGGLNRFDGYRFIPYRHQPDNENSLGDNEVTALAEDSQGQLWIGLGQQGVDRFDPATQTFTHFEAGEEGTGLSENGVFAVYVDSSDMVWVGTDGGGLNRIDPSAGTVTWFPHDGDSDEGISGGVVTAILEDSEGYLWLGSEEEGLTRLTRETGAFVRYQPDEDDPSSLAGEEVLTIFEDRQQRLWIGLRDVGMSRFDRATETFVHYKPSLETETSLEGDRASVDAVVVDADGMFWISHGGGLSMMDEKNGRFTHFHHDPLNPSSLSNDNGNALLVDRSGMVWVGTDGGGISLFNPRHLAFHHWREDVTNPAGLNNGFVRDIAIDGQGFVWLAAGAVLTRFDPASQQFTNYAAGSDALPIDAAHFVEVAPDGAIWVGAREEAVGRLEPETGKFTLFEHNPDDPTTIGGDRLRSLLVDAAGTVWVATDDERLSRFMPESSSFLRFGADDNPSSMVPEAAIRGLVDARTNGQLWFGYEGGGVGLFEPETAVLHNISYDDQLADIYHEKNVELLYEDGTGQLWIGTDGAGLLRLDTTSETIVQYNEEKGLPSDIVTGLLTDQEGNLWLSTAADIAKFNPTTETFVHYGLREGLLGTDFQEAFAADASSGLFYFGHAGGLLAFDPTTIFVNDHVPPLRLTDFRIFNQSVAIGEESVLTQTIDQTNAITLPYDASVFSFEFSALDFTRADQNRYAYIMEGFEQEWNEVDSSQRYVTYTSLPAGSYTFRVRGANNDGVWNEAGTAVSLTILPPWWETLWFRALLLVGSLGLILGGYQWRSRSMTRRNIELEQLVTERTEALSQSNQQLQAAQNEAEEARQRAEAANQAKSEFLSNMSHELRTPLNGILGYTQILQRETSHSAQTSEGLSIIAQSGQHLLTLINDVLDISKIEAGKLTLDPAQFHLPAFLHGINALMKMRAEQKELLYVADMAPGLPETVLADEKRLRQVLINLIGNAIKFTPSGWVSLRVAQVAQPAIPGEARLRFEVQDSGVGIDESNLVKIFQPFEQVGDKQSRAEGTGLGLAISQRLVTAMGGELRVESVVNKGSRFWFELSLPIVAEIGRAAQPPQRPIIGYEGDPIKVLIADDHPHNVMVLVNMLAPLGFETAVAANGAEAIARAYRLQPDVILLDLVMPELTGFEVVQQLRQDPAYRQTTIIAVSASVLERAQEESLAAGCDAFLPKPVNLADLLTLLQEKLALQWRYGDDGVEQPVAKLEEITAVPDHNILLELYDLARKGDMLALENQVDLLLDKDQTLLPFSQHIKRLTSTFEDEQLLAFLKQHIDNSEST